MKSRVFNFLMTTVISGTIALALILSGCTPLERTAYNVIVSSKAFLDAERKMHPECSDPLSKIAVCVTIARAVSAQNALVDAAEIYCSGPAFEAGGACQPPAKGTPALQQAVAKLQAAISTYEQIEKDVKGAMK